MFGRRGSIEERLVWIMGALPKAPFLFLLRDGRDVVDSDLAANSWLSLEVSDGELAAMIDKHAFEKAPRPKLREFGYS